MNAIVQFALRALEGIFLYEKGLLMLFLLTSIGLTATSGASATLLESVLIFLLLCSAVVFFSKSAWSKRSSLAPKLRLAIGY